MKTGALALLGLTPMLAADAAKKRPLKFIVYDRHSQLATAEVSETVIPTTIPEAEQAVVAVAKWKDGHLSICGCRHSGGGQAFASHAPLVDTTSISGVESYSEEEGTITVKAGTQWPELIEYLNDKNSPWTFRQKQTGNDRITIGGTLSANAHGQGLRLRPIVGDVRAFDLLDAEGKIRRCSLEENRELFSLVIGGYGNFGVITRATLQLTRKLKYRRTIESCSTKDIPRKYREAVESGCRYGDFQCNMDDTSDDYLRVGIWKQYQQISSAQEITPLRMLLPAEWEDLVFVAHTDKAKAWKTFSEGLLVTNGAVHYNEFWQGSPYVDDYHEEVDKKLGKGTRSSEVLTESYVPLDKIHDFLEDARAIFLSTKTSMVYSTVRFIEKDDVSFLPWARQLSACIIFNIHTDHTEPGKKQTKDVCRKIIDAAIKHGGSYYLTYHRWARKDQVLACYPQFVEFLRLKRKYDPARVFRSDWYAFYEDMFRRDL